MKKLLFVFAAVAIVAVAQAQESSIKFGVKAGANFSNVGGDDVEDTDMKVGFNGGATVNIPISSMFAVNPELLFSLQGWKEEGGKVNLSYLNIPILFQYVNPSGFFAETGPQIGFLMSAKAKPDDGDSEDIKDFFKSTDFAWALGAGFKTKSGLGFNARYNFGISNIVDADDADVKNSVIQVGVIYSFGGSK